MAPIVAQQDARIASSYTAVLAGNEQLGGTKKPKKGCPCPAPLLANRTSGRKKHSDEDNSWPRPPPPSPAGWHVVVLRTR